MDFAPPVPGFDGGLLPPDPLTLRDTAPLGAITSVMLVDGAIANRAAWRAQDDHTALWILDRQGDGVSQIQDILANYHDLQSVQIFSHGEAGAVQLGRTLLNAQTLDRTATALRAWGEALAPTGDLLFYGCNVGEGTAGSAFVQGVSALTGADVAASDDLTGSTPEGGDWDLEVRSGAIETPIRAIDDFTGVLNLSLSDLTNLGGQLNNWTLGNFLKLSGTFGVNAGDPSSYLKGSNISGFIGVGASTVTTADDVGLNLSGANLVFSDSNGDGNYEYALSNATVNFVGIGGATLGGTFSLSGTDSGLTATLNTFTLQLNDFVRFGGNGTLTANGTTLDFTGTNGSLFAGQGASTPTTADDVGLSLSNVSSAVRFTEGGKAYNLEGSAALVGLAGVTLEGNFRAQGNSTGGDLTLNGTLLTQGLNQVTGQGVTFGIADLTSFTGDLTFGFRSTDQAIWATGSHLGATVNLGSGLSGSVSDGDLALLWLAKDQYALQGSASASLTNGDLTFTGDLGFEVNRTGQALNETFNGQTLTFTTGDLVSRFKADHLDVALTGSLGTAIRAGADVLENIATSLLPVQGQGGSVLLTELPGTNTSLDSLLGISAYLSLGDQIDAYLNTAGSPTLQGLLSYLDNHWRTNLPTPLNLVSVLDSQGLAFSLVGDYGISKNINVGLPGEAASLGLVDLQGNANIAVNLTTKIDFDLSFKFSDFSAAFDLNTLDFSASAAVNDIVLGAYFGPLGVSLGSNDLGKQKGSLSLGFEGGISYSSNTLNFVAKDVDGSGAINNGIHVFLPLYATIAGVDVTGGTTPTITISGNPLVTNGVSFNAQGFAELLDFQSFDVGDVLYSLSGLMGWANSYRDYAVMNTAIPLLNVSLGDALDFATAIQDQILNKIDLNGVRTLDGLIAAINNAGVLPSGMGISYNATTREFALPFSFAQGFSPQNVNLDLGLNLGDLSLSTNATTQLAASVNGRLDLVVDFDGAANDGTLEFYVDNVGLNGDLSFDVSNLSVAAQLGFLGLTAGGATSGAHLAATVATALNQNGQRRFKVGQLLDGDLLDAFQLAFSGDGYARLKGLSVNGGFGNITIDPDVELGVYLPDLGDLGSLHTVYQPVGTGFDLTTAIAGDPSLGAGIVVVLPDISSILNLADLSFADILSGLQAGIAFLSDTLGDNAFFNTQLPIVNVSLADSFTFLSDLSAQIAQIAHNPAAALQQVEGAIEGALGIGGDAFRLGLQGNYLTIDLNWQALFSEHYDFNLDLQTIKALSGNAGAAALDAIDALADLNGGGNLLLEAMAQVQFAVAVDLTSLAGGDPDIAIRDYDASTGRGTIARVGARVEGTNLDLTFKAGPLDIGVVGGSVAIDGDGIAGKLNDHDWAGLVLKIDQTGGGADDGLFHLLTENLSDNLQVQVNGGFNVTLPILLNVFGMDFNLDPITIGTNPTYGDQGLWQLFLHLAGSPAAGSSDPLVMTFPDIQGEFAALGGDFSLLGLINDPSFILDGVDLAVGSLEDVLDSNLAQNLPLVGDKLASAAGFLREMRQGLLSDLREKLSGNGKAIEILREALWEVLGSGGLNLILDGDDAGSDISINDVQVAWFDNQGHKLNHWTLGDALPQGADALQFNLNLGGHLYGTGIDLPLDFHLPGFSLDVNGGFGLDIAWGFNFGFGLSLTDSFYLTTNANSDPELHLNISAFLDGSPGDPHVTTPFSATGQLLFFQADLVDNNPNGRASGLYGDLSLDLTGNSRGRLTLDRLLGGNLGEVFDVNLGVVADLDLQTTLSLAGADGLPRLRGDLVFHWDWSLGQALTSPGLDFQNFSVDLGSYVSHFLKPIAQKIHDALSPLKPLINAFTQTIAGLDVALPSGYEANLTGLINLLLVLNGRSPVDWSFLKEAKQMLGLVDAIASMPAGENWLQLGDIAGLGSSSGPTAHTGTIDQSKIDALSSQLMVDGKAIRQTSVTSGSSKTVRSGFQVFPYLKDLSNWMKLLSGGDATLFTYELPLLQFSADFRVLLFTYGIPKVASLDVNAIAGFSVYADLGFGYDTYGIRQAINSGNPLYALDGFYLMDWNLGGQEKDEFGLKGYIGLEGSVNLAIAKGGIDGKVTLKAGADFQDINKSILTKNSDGYVTGVNWVGDGKIRGSEILTMLTYDPSDPNSSLPIHIENLFNLSAELGLKADVFGEIYIPFDGWNEVFRKTIFETTLWETTYNAPNVQPFLAHKEGSTLYLHSGSRASQRKYGNTEDGGEVFNLYTDLASGGVGVEYDGYYQVFSGVTKVVADGGAGDDTFDASRLSNVTLEFSGGAGNDTLIAGSGAAIFDGGAGDDKLDATKSTQASHLKGGAGDDNLIGGTAGDILEGEDGDDRLSGGGGNDRLDGGRGSDRLTGGANDDTYAFANDFNVDRVTDSEGSNTFDFSAVTADLNATLNSRGVDVYYQSTLTNQVKGGTSIDRVILGQGDDQAVISDFGAGVFHLDDGGGNDTYRVKMDRATGSQGTGIINLTDNNGSFDQVVLEQANRSNPLALNQNQVANGREILNYNTGLERLTITGKAAQFDGAIADFGGYVSLTNGDFGGLARLGSTELRVIARQIDLQTAIQSQGIILESLNDLEINGQLNALNNGYLDLRTYGNGSNLTLNADLRVSSGDSSDGQGSGWIRLLAPDGAIVQNQGTILAGQGHLVVKAKGEIGNLAHPLHTQIARLTAISRQGDGIIQEADDLSLTNLEPAIAPHNPGFVLPSGNPAWLQAQTWIAALGSGWINTLADGNETEAIAVYGGDLQITLTGNDARLTLASGRLANLGGGNITLIADDMDFNSGANQLQGTGNLTLRSYHQNWLHRLGSIANGDGTPALDLSQGDLAALADGFALVTFGAADQGHTLQIGDIIQSGMQPEWRDRTLILARTIQVLGDARGTGSPLTLRADDGINFSTSGRLTTNALMTLIADADGNGSGGIFMADGAVINAVTQTIDLDATENITLGLLTTSGAVTVDSSSGAILDGDLNNGLDVIAQTAILQAAQGIGVGNPLETQVAYLEAAGHAGGIWIANQGNLVLGEISALDGVSAQGTIVISTAGAMTVKENVTSGQNLTLRTLDSSNAGEDLTAIAGVTLTGQNVTLQAGDNLWLQADSTVQALNQILIQGDWGNADGGVGSRIDLDGSLDALAILVQGQTDDDIIDIHVQSWIGEGLVQGDAGSDLIQVDRLPSLDLARRGQGDRYEITLDGQGDGDAYIINITGPATDYRINVFDSGSGGADLLTINGTNAADQFLLRASRDEFNPNGQGGLAFVAALHGATDGDPDTLVERINYNRALENLVLETHDGDDGIALDDNWVKTTIRGGAGADQFQVGQIFKAQRDALAGLAASDYLAVTGTTRGYLTNGITSATTLEGGEGDDTFTVFRNLAALDLQGQNGDDLFVIRAFAKEGSFTSEVDSGEGSDTVEYVINAPVNVNGGAGTDTLRVIGTEFADKFIVTADAIFGAGRTVTYTGVEIVEIDGAEGKDEFYVLSTNATVVTSLFGGLGSDYFSLGGDTAQVQAGIPTADDFFHFDFIEADGKILPQIAPHTVDAIQGALMVDGFGGSGSAGGLTEPVLLPGETNLLASSGTVRAYTNTNGAETLTVATADLQAAAIALALTGLGDLVGKTVEISRGPGLRRFWRITDLVNAGETTVLNLLSPTQPAPDWGLPDGSSEFAITSLSANFFVNEAEAQDRLSLFEDGDLTDNSGSLSATVIAGLGLGPAGVTYGNFEMVELLLGRGNDQLTISDTADGAITAVHGGGGNDTILALDRGTTDDRGLAASLVIFGDTTEDGDRYSGAAGQATPGYAKGFPQAGNDFIDASALTAIVSIDGGAGNDTIYGGQAGDHLAGGAGNDTIAGNGGDDHLYGDADFNLDLVNRVLTVPTTAIAGADTLNGGTGADIILGDLGIISQTADTQRILTTGNVIRVETNQFTNGAADAIQGGDDNDLILGGAAGDTINAGAGHDLVFGDHGLVSGTVDLNRLPLDQAQSPFTFTAIATQNSDGGGDDIIHGDGGDDILLGQQGADRLFGDAGNDDLIGGHNVSGGQDGADQMDGGAGEDGIAGDNAQMLRRPGTSSPRFRTLSGDLLYDADGNPLVNGTAQNDPLGSPRRDITLLDHNDSTPGDRYGDDQIAGGAGHDTIFGQLGNDLIQGDGAIGAPPSRQASDGDDYIEGNGGNDILYGNGGQDDLIGGSSNLYGLTSPNQRPDGSDTIYGGAGDGIARNDLGDGTNRDADAILGDNGNLFRILNTNGSFRRFTYDLPQTLVIRGLQLLDYTLGGGAGDRGATDLLHGEMGDDVIHGMTGHDVIFGEAGNDDLYGGSGSDRLYGGSGSDGILGDDGKLYTSRNGLAESLYGLGVNNTTTLSLPGPFISVDVYTAGELFKTVKLSAFNQGGNDIIYGGLGDDFLHGGAGDDGISGAEALATFYTEAPQTNLNPLAYDPTTGKFAAYDANNAMAKIANFFLNFAATDSFGKINDGRDRLFGDHGNDWLVGGTQTDFLFGGLGDDLINADDNLDTNGGLNNLPDDPQFADADYAFGGDGRDVLIANTGGDRLFDWLGEYNSFLVPFSPFGPPTINRAPSPQILRFLLDLGRANGADFSLTEPNGELGLVDQSSSLWSLQHGAPRDPQPGNTAGTQRDTQGRKK